MTKPKEPTESQWIWISAFARKLKGLTEEQQQSEMEKQPAEVADLMQFVSTYRDLPLELDRDRSGEKVGDFELIQRIGAGGMGEVYLARETSQLHNGRKVAVKLIRWPPTLSPQETEERISRFKAEVEKLSKHNSAHVVNLFKADIYKGSSGEIVPYLAMQYISESRSLRDYVREVELEPTEILRLMTKICRGIQHIHDLDIIHSDLKPENILVDSEGEPRLTDFGLAKVVGDAVPRAQDGMGEGTPAYMSPEQVSDVYGEITKKSDVYALGVILYELLASKLPYAMPVDSSPDERLNEIRQRILEEEPTPLDSIKRLFSGQVESILKKALAKSPKDRFASADAMKFAIERALRQTDDAIGVASRELMSALVGALPPKVTAQQLYSESYALTELGNFEQAAIKAEEASDAAAKESEEKLRWMASLHAARSWFNYLSSSQALVNSKESLETRIAKNIEAAAQAGAPAGAISLAEAKLAIHQRNYDEATKLSSAVLGDPTCEELDRAEALVMKLQALLFSERLDDALACNDEVTQYREITDGERKLLIEATWLRILCESQLATDDDVLCFVRVIEHVIDVPPQVRLNALDLVVPHFSMAAQDPQKQIAAEIVVERLNKLKRLPDDLVSQLNQLRKQLSDDFFSQFNDLLEDSAAQQSTTGERMDELQASIVTLGESVRPDIGDRHDQTLRLLETGYDIVKPTGDAVTLVNLAGQIAEMSALRCDTAKTELFLGHCDSWVEASKDGPDKEGRAPWFSLRAKVLIAKGRTLYRLGRQLFRDGRPAERSLMAAKQALEEAQAFGRENRAKLHGNAELFLAEVSFWLGQIAVQLGLNENAANYFHQTRSPAAMTHPGFSRHVGMQAWLNEAESRCFSGQTQRAVEVISELLAAPSVPESIKSRAEEFKSHLDRNVIPVVDWFSSASAARIREMARRQGLRAAIATQTKYLIDWHQQFFQSDGVPNLAPAYDFWGRGGFSRISAAIQAMPDSAIAVDAFTLEDVRCLARLLCPLFDTVIVKWKGAISPDSGICVIPDPAPDGDEFGDFFGGMGLVRCSDDVLIGTSGNLLPNEVGEFLATEALPLIQSGRLILLPAPFVGCTQSAIGWTDDLLTRHFLKGVINGAGQDSAASGDSLHSINIGAAIPFIDGVSLPDLARVLDDVTDFILPLRSMVFATLSSNIARKRLAQIYSVERDFRGACRKLHEVLTATMPKQGASNWTVKTFESYASAITPGAAQIGSDPNSDALRSVTSVDEELAPWIPFFHLQGLKGYLNWSHRLDNPSKPDAQTPFGSIQHTWLYPGTGGPGCLMVRKVE